MAGVTHISRRLTIAGFLHLSLRPTMAGFLLTALLALLSAGQVHAQKSVGIGTSTPDTNAVLDIRSTGKGVLIPALTTAQQNALAAMLGPGETGMLVTDATTGKLVSWGGSSFQPFTTTHTPTAAAPLTLTASTLRLNPGTATGDLLTWDGNNWVNLQPAVQHFSTTIDNRQPWLSVNYCISLFGIFPSQNGGTPYVGEIDMFGCNFAPNGWAFCNGALLSISQYEVLFVLIGTTYGGDGVTTFALPDLRGRVPIHMGSNGTSNYIIGESLGVEQNTFQR